MFLDELSFIYVYAYQDFDPVIAGNIFSEILGDSPSLTNSFSSHDCYIRKRYTQLGPIVLSEQ